MHGFEQCYAIIYCMYTIKCHREQTVGAGSAHFCIYACWQLFCRPIFRQIVNALDLLFQGQILEIHYSCNYSITVEHRSVIFGMHLEVNNQHHAIKICKMFMTPICHFHDVEGQNVKYFTVWQLLHNLMGWYRTYLQGQPSSMSLTSFFKVKRLDFFSVYN